MNIEDIIFTFENNKLVKVYSINNLYDKRLHDIKNWLDETLSD